MLNASINIISTLNPNMQPVEPAYGRSIGSIHLGLIHQFHYVALVKKSDMVQVTVQKPPTTILKTRKEQKMQQHLNMHVRLKGTI